MTREQLNYIKKGLKKLDLTDDIVDEITDHWACEIERLMLNSNTFEYALKSVYSNWGKELDYTYLWFTNNDTFPKIMAKRVSAINKKGAMIAIMAILVYSLMFFGFKYFNLNFLIFQQIIFSYLAVSSLYFLVKGIQLKYKNKYSTIYSYLLTNRYSFISHLLYCLFIYFLSDFFSNPTNPFSVHNFWTCFGLYYNVMHFYYHFKLNKFQKSNKNLLVNSAL
jgi:hypothetical protein